VTRFQRTLCCSIAILSCASAFAAEPQIKSGLTPEDYAYTLAEGVTKRAVTYYSDDVACFAILFFPKGFSPNSSVPGIVLAQGWTGTHQSIEKYGARFAEHGFVAMVIDYRGWGKSNGFATLAEKSLQARPRNDDSQRFIRGEFPIEIKRTRLEPVKQVEDIRNAISYLQGEPGVDRDRIGVWGSSFAGGNAIAVAAMDARVKAIALQAPSIAGKDVPAEPFQLKGRMLEDAIRRARTGRGAEMETGYLQRRKIDYETNQLVAEFRPFHQLQHIGDRPVLFVVAENEELFDNSEHAFAAARVLTGPARVLEIPEWFKEHLKK
jgi:dienelactone hydrolase